MDSKFLTLFAAVASALVSTSHAELPPSVYLDLQKKAGEVLKIRADEVNSKPKGLLDRSSYTETVTATVVSVERSKSKTKANDVITIVYQREVPEKGWVGPSPAPRLKKAEQYTAYLVKNADGTYAIAAKGMSFSKSAD